MNNEARTIYDKETNNHSALLNPPNGDVRFTIWIENYENREDINSLNVSVWRLDYFERFIEFPFKDRIDNAENGTYATFSIPANSNIPIPYKIMIHSEDNAVNMENFKFLISWKSILV